MKFLLAWGLAVAACSPVSAALVETTQDGVVIPVNDGFLNVRVVSDSIVRVAFAHDRAFFDRSSLIVVPQGHVAFSVTDGSEVIEIRAKLVRVRIAKKTGVVTFLDRSGRTVLGEEPGGRTLAPAVVQGVQTFNVRQQWKENGDESLYGLGQQQLGLMNIKRYDLDLWQHNATVSVPFLVSSRGYGILWDNLSYTRFGDLRQLEAIPPAALRDVTGKAGGVNVTYFSDNGFLHSTETHVDSSIDSAPPANYRPLTNGQPQAQPAPVPVNVNPTGPPRLPRSVMGVRWEGSVVPDVTGDTTFQAYSNGGIKLWLDGRLVMSHWRQSWLPWKDVAKIHLVAGKPVHLKLDWDREQGNQLRLEWKTPTVEHSTALWSQVADGEDYYFVYGPDLDHVVAGYRQLTGSAPMMPAWAFGLWQSRQRYNTQQDSLDVVDGFRSRHIPFDNIVQDWFYWRPNAWGSHQFDPTRFPDPDGWIKAIHDRHARLMISVWGKFYPGTDNFEAMHSRGFLYELNLTEHLRDWVGYPYTFYDAFNLDAQKLFWNQINDRLFKKGADAWWMDASEPDLLGTPTLEGTITHMNPTALGPATRVLNGYALENSRGIYEGQRSAAPDQRVFILTRSGGAGQQRYAAATWSGDISSTWTAMQKQIPAGLGFSLSGVPYWTMDTGGFSVPGRFSARTPKPEDLEEWRELNARWFEYASFVPMLRVHGETPYREMWQFGGESSPAYKAELKFDRLRYRLFPYIYSLAGNVTQAGGTIMRPLVMDFRGDRVAREIGDEYMFGPALLVSPVTTHAATSRPVYLPKAAGWYDFWTGASAPPGRSIVAPAPYDSIPVHVKAGSIIPVGPEIQYTGEKPSDPTTLYVYAGADGEFSIYEDDGLTYQYEKGAFTNIPIRWRDSDRTLTIGKRTGSFPGMLSARTFNVVIVSSSHPVGFSFDAVPDRTINYTGSAIVTKL